MPKMKSNRGAAKRFKKTASGFKRKQAFKRHILTKKSPKRIRFGSVPWSRCTHPMKRWSSACCLTPDNWLVEI